MHNIWHKFQSRTRAKNLKNETKSNDEKKRKRKMVYCTRCGTKNEDTAVTCVKCGTTLQTGTMETRRYERKRAEEECFGLPHGGIIAALVIGVLILLWGFFALAEQQGWITRAPEFWWLIIIIIGVLMIAGALYRMSRRP